MGCQAMAITAEMWMATVLWLAVLVLSQFIRASKSSQGALLAFGAVFGFALTLLLMSQQYVLLSIVMLFMNIYILYEALDRW